jgi:hypothetical protein
MPMDPTALAGVTGYDFLVSGMGETRDVVARPIEARAETPMAEPLDPSGYARAPLVMSPWLAGRRSRHLRHGIGIRCRC